MRPLTKFSESIAANIAYWHNRLGETSDGNFADIDLDRSNLYRAVEFGLSLQDTWPETTKLVIQCFEFIIQRGYYREWIPVMERVIYCCTGDDQALKGRALDQLGILYRRNRQLDAAISSHEEEERIGELLDDDSRKAFARMHLSAVYWRKHRYDLAETYGMEALRGFSQLEDNEEKVASCLINLGNIALSRGELDQAEEHLLQAIVLYRRLGQPANLANALKNLSTVHETAGRYDEALLELIEASDILEPTDYEIDKATVEINIGTLYFRKEELDLAEAAFKRADSPYMREYGPIFYRALTANNLGNVYLVRKQWDLAERYLQASVALFRQARSQIYLANSLSGVAEARVGKGRSEEAIPFYEEALSIVSGYPEDAWGQRLQKEFSSALRELVDNGEE